METATEAPMFSQAQAIIRAKVRESDDGFVRMWVVDTHDARRTGWRKLNAVDAVEHLMQGTASFEAPAGAQSAPQPQQIRSGAEARGAGGSSRVSPYVDTASPGQGAPVELPKPGLTEEQLSAMSWDDVKRLAAMASVQVGGRTRQQIVSELAGFEPPQEG